jgi:hypothetical protein
MRKTSFRSSVRNAALLLELAQVPAQELTEDLARLGDFVIFRQAKNQADRQTIPRMIM